MITALIAALALAQAPGTITTVAGNGNPIYTGDGVQATTTAIGGGSQSLTIAVDTNGNLILADQTSNRIRRVNSSGIISTIGGGGTTPGLGDGGPATSAQVFPNGIAIDANNNIYIASGAQIRRIDSRGIITTIAGTGIPGNSGDGGPALSAQFSAVSIAVDPANNIYIADSLLNRIRKISTNGIITAFAGSGTGGFSGDGGAATAASLSLPQGLASDNAGNIYFTDGGSRIRKISTSGIISTLGGNGSPIGIGDGIAATATGMTPSNVVIDSSGAIFYSDTGTNRVRRIAPNGLVSTISGSGIPGFTGDGGPAAEARLYAPRALALDSEGNLYVTDTNNYRIRKIWGVATTAGPAFSSSSIVHGASFRPGITPNGFASILGTNLSTGTSTWDRAIADGRLPTSLESVSVTIDDKPAYLSYVSPTQINLLVPNISVGPVVVTLTSASGVKTSATVVARLYDPAFVVWPGDQPVATRRDFSFVARTGTFAGLPTTPAKPGEVLILWGLGFGPTQPATPFGIQVPSTATYSTSIPPLIMINGIRATVYGAALAPGFAGLYQVAIEVPPSLADGNWPVTVTMGGVTSPTSVQLAVRR